MRLSIHAAVRIPPFSASRTLAALTLSNSTVAENTVTGTTVGAIQGTTSGSTLSILSQSNAAWFAISGSNLTIGASSPDFETNAAPTVTIRETLAGATNTPRDTVFTMTVTDVAENTPPSFVRIAAVSHTTGVSTISPALPTVDGAGGRLLALVSVSPVDANVTTATAGWTRLASYPPGVGSTAALFEAAEGAAAPTFDFTGPGSIAAQIAYYKSTTHSLTGFVLKNSAHAYGSTHTSATYTTDAANALDVYADCSWLSITGLATPAGFTEDSESAPSSSHMLTVGSKQIAASGSAAGAISVAHTGGDGYWRMFRLQLA